MAQLPNLFDLLRGPQHDAVSVGVRAWRPAVLVSVNLYFPPAKVSFSRIRSHEIFNLSATVARASARHSLGGGARMTAGRVVINQRPPPLPRRVHSGPGTHRHNQLWEYFNMQWAKLSPECVFPLLAPRRRHSLGGGARTAASSVGISQFLFPSNKVSFSRIRCLQQRSRFLENVPSNDGVSPGRVHVSPSKVYFPGRVHGGRPGPDGPHGTTEIAISRIIGQRSLSLEHVASNDGVFLQQGSRRQTWTGRCPAKHTIVGGNVFARTRPLLEGKAR
jgi:hypothetical protein